MMRVSILSLVALLLAATCSGFEALGESRRLLISDTNQQAMHLRDLKGKGSSKKSKSPKSKKSKSPKSKKSKSPKGKGSR